MTNRETLAATSDDPEDLAALLEALDIYMTDNPTALGPVEAKAQNTTFLSSGLPQITELIIALGTSGAIAALTTILVSYFDKRPRARIKLRRSAKNGETIDLSAENLDPKSLTTFLSKVAD